MPEDSREGGTEGGGRREEGGKDRGGREEGRMEEGGRREGRRKKEIETTEGGWRESIMQKLSHYSSFYNAHTSELVAYLSCLMLRYLRKLSNEGDIPSSLEELHQAARRSLSK